MALTFQGNSPFSQRDVRETPAATSSSSSSSTIIAPIGSIVAWLKSFTNTPQALPTGWMEADGSAINDADSVYNGQNAPDLNGNEFIRGAATSGGTGGGTTGAGSAHTHTTSGTSAAGSAHTHTQDGSVSSHTLTEAEIPTHRHSVSVQQVTATSSGTNIKGTDQINAATRYTSYTGDGEGHTHSDTFSNANESAHTHGIGSYVAATESAHTHASQPKFYDVVWIFRYK